MLGFFCETFAKNRSKKFRGEIWNTSPALGKNIKKAASSELACVYELQQIGATLVQKLNLRKIINTNDECLEKVCLKAGRPHGITALAEEKYPRQKAIGFFYETFVNNSKINDFWAIRCLAKKIQITMLPSYKIEQYYSRRAPK